MYISDWYASLNKLNPMFVLFIKKDDLWIYSELSDATF